MIECQMCDYEIDEDDMLSECPYCGCEIDEEVYWCETAKLLWTAKAMNGHVPSASTRSLKKRKKTVK